MNTNDNKTNNNPFSVRINIDVNFATEEELNTFLEKHTCVRTVCVEADSGELTSLDLEAFEIEEIVELTDDYE